MLKLAFFSSSPLSIEILESLSKNFDIKLIITSPDKPTGRKQEMTPSPLKIWALNKNIQCFTPVSLKENSGFAISQFINSNYIDISIVIDYGLLIPAIIFNAPKYKTLNIHFSNLPKFRGPYPDAFVILNGEKTTAISVVCIDEGFDTGNILAQKEVGVKDTETAGGLHQRLYKITSEILPYIVNSWADYNMNNNYNHNNDNNHYIKLYLPPKKQKHDRTNYTKMLSREDGFIAWQTLHKAISKGDIKPDDLPNLIRQFSMQNLQQILNDKFQITNKLQIKNDKTKIHNLSFIIYNFYRALSPWPGMWTKIKLTTDNLEQKTEKRLKILKAHMEDGNFVIDEIQLEGKKPTSWKQFQSVYLK